MPRVNLGISEREKEIVAAMREIYGGNYVNATQVGNYLGITAPVALQYLRDVPRIKLGRAYRFAMQDVARAIAKMEEST